MPRFQHPPVPQLPSMNNPAMPTGSTIPALCRDSLRYRMSGSARVAQQSTYPISAVRQDPPAPQPSRMTKSERDQTASAGAWAGLFDTPPAATRQSQRPSALSHPRNAHHARGPDQERPSPPAFRCDHCDRRFHSRHALNRHRSAMPCHAQAKRTPGFRRPGERNTRRPTVHMYVVPRDVHRPVRA